ncbi:hypothetical protein AB6C47_009665 [Vibrio cyclitrophicus]
MWGELGNSSGEYTQVTSLPIYADFHLPKSILLSWLQSLCDWNLISIRHEMIYINGDEELMNIIEEGLSYDPLNKALSLGKNTNPCSLVSNNKIREIYYEQNQLENSLELLLKIFKAKNVAMCYVKQLPTVNGKQFSAVTTGNEIGNNGHPNAISEVKDNKVVIRWCQHCKSGHGSTTSICDDSDSRFTDFEINSFIKEHGVYLVR